MSSTPTVLVDGEIVEGATIDDLVAQIEQRIEQGGAAEKAKGPPTHTWRGAEPRRVGKAAAP